MPFAVFVYAPRDEFALRGLLKDVFARLRKRGLDPIHVSLAALAHASVAEAHARDGGWERLYDGERKRRTWKTAVQSVNHALTAEAPLPDKVVEALAGADPDR